MTVEEERVFAIRPGERVARLEENVRAVREDIGEMRADIEEIKTTFKSLEARQLKHDVYATLGRRVWGIIERVLLVVGGGVLLAYIQGHLFK